MRTALHDVVLVFCIFLGSCLVWRRLTGIGTSKLHFKYTSNEMSKTSRGSTAGNYRPRLPGTFGVGRQKRKDKMIVMGKMSHEKTDWVEQLLPDWHHSIYVVNDSSAPLHTNRNKGREANAYLTFIIENYKNLPDTTVFIHSHRTGYPRAWHTDAIGYDIVKGLNSLNFTHVQTEGYINLRCITRPGCGDEAIEPRRHAGQQGPLGLENAAGLAWLEVWPLLFGNREEKVPEQIASACCAQFAVSREQVLMRPLKDYVRYHRWLMETSMSDEVSGRIMEHAWHMIFGKEPVHCPDMIECYANLYPDNAPYAMGDH